MSPVCGIFLVKAWLSGLMNISLFSCLFNTKLAMLIENPPHANSTTRQNQTICDQPFYIAGALRGVWQILGQLFQPLKYVCFLYWEAFPTELPASLIPHYSHYGRMYGVIFTENKRKIIFFYKTLKDKRVLPLLLFVIICYICYRSVVVYVLRASKK